MAKIKKNKKSFQKVPVYQKIENFFNQYKGQIIALIIITVAYIVVGFSLFQFNISLGEDDSAYILAAKKFLEGKSFPTWHGSFYPIFLSFFMSVFGVNLLIFKFINFILMFLQIVLLFFAFKNRVPNLILFLTLLFLSINSFIIYYASQTYSEALYMFIQAAVILAFFSLEDKLKQNPKFKEVIWDWLIFGFLMFLLTITRNIGWAILITAILYFLVTKRPKEAILSFLVVFIFYIPYNLYKIKVWGLKQVGFEGQFTAIFLKNPYNKNLGYEDLNGFINRFLVNSNQYLSKHLFNILGYTQTIENNVILTIIAYLAFIFTLIVIWRKRKELLFPIFYIGIGVAVTFISQQTFWDQDRLILIYIPLIVLLFSVALYDFFKKWHKQWLAYLFLLSIILFSGIRTKQNIKLYSPIRKEILAGNKYAGLTPDWVNYFKMTEYVKNTLPDSVVVACRKPGIAFIVSGGREFFGIYKFLAEHIDTVINNAKKIAIASNRSPFIIKFNNSPQSINKLYQFYPYYDDFYAVINNYSTQSVYALFLAKDSLKRNQMVNLAQQLNLQYFTNLDSLRKKIIIKTKSDYAAYPDTLLKFFHDKNIQYVIVANLRKVMNDPKAGIITTIHRYLTFIEYKFPGTFKVVHKIGQSEPALLLKVDYYVHPHLVKNLYNNNKPQNKQK